MLRYESREAEIEAQRLDDSLENSVAASGAKSNVIER
jgi:hypothetical protein